MPLSKDDVSGIETVAHYTHDEDQAYLMLYGAPRFPAALPGEWENETGARGVCALRREGGASRRLSQRRCAGRLGACAARRWDRSVGASGDSAVSGRCAASLAGEGVFETIPIEADYTVTAR